MGLQTKRKSDLQKLEEELAPAEGEDLTKKEMQKRKKLWEKETSSQQHDF